METKVRYLYHRPKFDLSWIESDIAGMRPSSTQHFQPNVMFVEVDDTIWSVHGWYRPAEVESEGTDITVHWHESDGTDHTEPIIEKYRDGKLPDTAQLGSEHLHEGTINTLIDLPTEAKVKLTVKKYGLPDPIVTYDWDIGVMYPGSNE